MPTNKIVFVIVDKKSSEEILDLRDGLFKSFGEDGFGIIIKKANNSTTLECCLGYNPTFVFIDQPVEKNQHFKNFHEIIENRCPESNIHVFETLDNITDVWYRWKFHSQEVV